jgi:hypothetical protein
MLLGLMGSDNAASSDAPKRVSAFKFAWKFA